MATSAKVPTAVIRFEESQIKVTLTDWSGVPLSKLDQAMLAIHKEALAVRAKAIVKANQAQHAITIKEAQNADS